MPITEHTGEAVYLSASNRHHELVYPDSHVSGINSLGFVVWDGDTARTIRNRVVTEGLPIIRDKPTSVGVKGDFFVRPEGGGLRDLYRHATSGPWSIVS